MIIVRTVRFNLADVARSSDSGPKGWLEAREEVEKHRAERKAGLHKNEIKGIVVVAEQTEEVAA